MFRSLLFATVCFASHVAMAADEAAQLTEKHLQAGTLAEGETALESLVKRNAKDDQARFGLGAVQFLRAIENLSQSLYRHGALQGQIVRLGAFMGADLPLPNNPDPKPLSYDQAREIVGKLVANLTAAEATLAKIESPDVKLPIHFGLVRLDLDGDGQADELETLWRIYERVNRQSGATAEAATQFVISFDAADVAWLRGYCHLLLALHEPLLAYDWREAFERTAHLFFARPETPYAFLLERDKSNGPFGSFAEIADAIAWIHLLNFKLVEPKRMQSALDHLQAMVSLSRKSWDLILKETDDDNEWIPSPSQKRGVIPNVVVTEEMVGGWRKFLDEAEALLKGEKLIPFWRQDPRGVNLRKVFAEPRSFDLVLWVQGTAAAPYLEIGSVTDKAVWERLQRVFQGEFIGFALWFN